MQLVGWEKRNITADIHLRQSYEPQQQEARQISTNVSDKNTTFTTSTEACRYNSLNIATQRHSHLQPCF